MNMHADFRSQAMRALAAMLFVAWLGFLLWMAYITEFHGGLSPSGEMRP